MFASYFTWVALHMILLGELILNNLFVITKEGKKVRLPAFQPNSHFSEALVGVTEWNWIDATEYINFAMNPNSTILFQR